MTKKRNISSVELLKLANDFIKQQECYIEGMMTDEVEENDGVLIFKGHYFLDNNGLPTATTTLVFNLFKLLAVEYSKKYTLQSIN